MLGEEGHRMAHVIELAIIRGGKRWIYVLELAIIRGAMAPLAPQFRRPCYLLYYNLN